ncbi:PHB depolymerase family esterase [Micromonospora zhanjiangensis]
MLALLVGLTAPAACTTDPAGGRSAPTPSVGTSEHTLSVDGRDRTYRLYRPASADPVRPVPLVVVLHGAAGTGEQAEEAYGWTGAADRDGFLVAFPNGLNRAWAVGPDCCGAPARDGVDDVHFVTELVAGLGRNLPVDPTRRYVTGISNGGLLAYRLVCDTTLFAAIGAVATTSLGQCPSPAPTSVLHIHGRQDQTMPYDGGPGRRDNGGTGRNPVKIDGPPTPELVARWRTVDGCAAPTVTTAGTATRTAAACAQGRHVELITIADAGHQWPGSRPNPPVAQKLLHLDPPSTALKATDTIWRFFQANPKPAGG